MKSGCAIIICMVFAASANLTRAEEPDAATKQTAATVAVGTCATCHGPGGNSVSPKFPKLAGQREGYLKEQLKAFRSQTRGDPDALAYMWGMAAPLDDAMIDALSHYYESQKPSPGKPGDSALMAKGKEIYEKGIPPQNVPACATCHGPNGEGSAQFPRLAGQHAAYLMKQLNSFQSGLRNIAVMHGITKEMKLSEMAGVAAYLQSKN